MANKEAIKKTKARLLEIKSEANDMERLAEALRRDIPKGILKQIRASSEAAEILEKNGVTL